MRTLPSALTTAQQNYSHEPHTSVRFISPDGATIRLYNDTNVPNRIRSVQQAEAQYGGAINLPGSRYPIAAVIRLGDNDNTLVDLEWKGYQVRIGWGYNTTSGRLRSEGPECFVVDQKAVSVEGDTYIELHCIDLWGLAQINWVNQTATGLIKYNKDISVRHILQELLGGSKLAAAVHLDGATYIDYLTASQNTSDGGTGGDVVLLPATPAVNDAFYFGLATIFDRVTLDLTTVGVGTWTLTWEIWDGSVWRVVEVTDDISVANPPTADFQLGELISYHIDSEGTYFDNWATRNMSGVDAAFPNSSLYYIRARVSAYTSITTQPKATRIFAGQHFGVTLDTSAAGQGDNYQPSHVTSYNANIAVTLEEILAGTKLGVRLERDGFHAIFVDPAGSVDYTYDIDGAHTAHTADLRDSAVLPNRIIAVEKPLSDGIDPTYSGQDNNAASQTAFGVITHLYADPAITSNELAALEATKRIEALERDLSQGEIDVPLNCGQEVWDLIQVQDNRNTQTYNGRVNMLIREFQPGHYRMRIVMGGWRQIAAVMELNTIQEYDEEDSEADPLSGPFGSIGVQPTFTYSPNPTFDYSQRNPPGIVVSPTPTNGVSPTLPYASGSPGSNPWDALIGSYRLVPEQVVDNFITTANAASKVQSAALTQTLLSKGGQAFNSTIEFSASAYNRVDWTSGTIAFADGTTLSVNSGFLASMTDSTTYYATVNTGTGLMTITTVYGDAIADTALLLAIVAIGVSTDGDEPTILPFGAKVPTISAVAIAANVIVAGHIRARTITATQIATGTITATEIESRTITATQIEAGTITADELSATAINSMTITGATIRTSASGARVEMDDTALSIVGGSMLLFKKPTGEGQIMRIDALDNYGFIVMTSAPLYLSATHFSPILDGSVDLGSTATGWNDIFVKNDILPINTITSLLGSSSKLFHKIYVEQIHLGGSNPRIHGFDNQTTVGSAGSASALPGAPLGYILLVVNLNTVAVPYWAAA